MAGHAILLNIAGGVALLLWALRMVRTGIMRAYGARVRGGLAKACSSPGLAAVGGIGSAVILQSATATAVLTASFARRGLIPTSAALAVLLGADVGSTLAVQVLSLNIAAFSPVLLLSGFAAFTLSDKETVRQVGRIAIGIGLILIALNLVLDAASALRTAPALQFILMRLASDLVLTILVAVMLTWIMHSSVAMVLLVMSFARLGTFELPLAMALVLGANIGSALIAVLLTAPQGPAARRMAFGNLAFRTLGALALLPAMPLLATYSAAHAVDGARFVANFHTAFNVLLATAGLPIVSIAAKLLERLIPDQPTETDTTRPRYLSLADPVNPSEAIARATRETLRIADIVESMLRDVIELFAQNDHKLLKNISDRDDAVDGLHEEIKLYLARIDRSAMSNDELRLSTELMSFATNLEHVGDIIDRNLLQLARKKMRQRVSFSSAGWHDIRSMHASALKQLGMAVDVLVSRDVRTARALMREKERMRAIETSAREAHLQRLREGQLVSIDSSSLHLDVLRDIKRVAAHLAAVAYPILEAAGELRASRLSVAAGQGESDSSTDAPVRIETSMPASKPS